MIDINELRQSAQAATPGPWYIGSGTYEGRNIYSVEAVTDDEGFTYNPVVATAEDDDVVCWEANARLIAAANPAVISELLDRLEAAEADALEQARLNGMGSEREAALMAKLEAAEKSDAESLAMYRRARDERDALRAKIARMERQEPVAWARKLAMGLPSFGCVTDLKYRPSNMPESAYMPLYALPGAQVHPAPSVPECPYPCGWRNLLKHAIEDGAYLARSINEDEPVTENARSVAMLMVMRLRDVLMAVNNAAPEANP